MAAEIVMPRLSDSMEEGTILKWLVDQGGEVKRGEPLVEIETDKANMVYDADTDGVLVEVLGKEGDTFPVGEVIARIGDVGDSSEQIAVGRPEPEAAPERESAPEPQPSPPPPSRESGGNGGDPERIKASPVARRMAREMGVELELAVAIGAVHARVLAQRDRGRLHDHVVERRWMLGHALEPLAQLDGHRHVDLGDQREVGRRRLRLRHTPRHGLLKPRELDHLGVALGAGLANLGAGCARFLWLFAFSFWL